MNEGDRVVSLDSGKHGTVLYRELAWVGMYSVTVSYDDGTMWFGTEDHFSQEPRDG